MIWMRSRFPLVASFSAATRNVGALPVGAVFKSLPIATVHQPSEAEQAAGRQQRLERIERVFRKNDPDSDSDWATALLRRFVTDYRLGHAPAEE